jgi:alkylation response protein AidB-like acyl-CoA dehydrogenase
MGSQQLEPLVGGLTAAERELVSAATSVVPVLSANAEKADADRRLPEEAVQALRAAGLFRLGAPAAYGGHAAGMQAALATAAELGRGCSAASWVTSLFYSATAVIGFYPDRVRREVWGDGPDVTACGALGVPVAAVRKGRGYMLNGRWGWVSGARHADWAVLDVTTAEPAPDRRMALVPMTRLSIEDTWHMTGMRGTGSDTVVADGVFVPDDYVISFSAAAAGAYRRADEPLTLVDFPAGWAAVFAGTPLGMGVAIYDYVTGKLRGGKPLVAGAARHPTAIEAPGVQANVADAAMLLDSAMLHAGRSAALVDQAVLAGETLPAVAAARIRMDTGFATRYVRRAVDLLLDAAGASSFAQSGPAERIWRDLGTASRHPAFRVEIDREQYAEVLLSQDHVT